MTKLQMATVVQRGADLLAITEAHTPNLEGFMLFCDVYLLATPGSNTVYLDGGVGIRLVNGDIVAVGPPQTEHRMRDTGLPITGRLGNAMGGVIPSASYQVTR